MGKLQPNFSWQKYEGEAEDQREQFQYQLQQQHVQVSNTVNGTIDDESYFLRERATSFAWTDNKQIYTKTITGTIGVAGINTYAHGIKNISTVIDISGCFFASGAFSSARPLPYVDPTALANCIGVYMDSTNIIITTANPTWNGSGFNITITYTKVRI